MNRIKFRIITVTLSLFAFIFIPSNYAFAKINIVTSVPNLASIAKEIGKNQVKVKSIARGYQNPHYVDAKPSYVLDLNRADLLVYIGLDLEVGWLPRLVTGARNSKINKGSNGDLDASTLIPLPLEVLQNKVDRSMGDIHPSGNPHFLLDPRNAIIVARGITEKLVNIDPENSAKYRSNLADFTSRLENKITKWESMLAPHKGTKFFTYHKLWTYFLKWAGFEEIGTIEQKPGIGPSPRHLRNIINIGKSSDVRLVIASNYHADKTGKAIAKAVGVQFLSLPVQVGGEKNVKTYTDLIDLVVSRITSNLQNE